MEPFFKNEMRLVIATHTSLIPLEHAKSSHFVVSNIITFELWRQSLKFPFNQNKLEGSWQTNKSYILYTVVRPSFIKSPHQFF